MRTDVEAVEEIVDTEDRDLRRETRVSFEALREAPVPTPLSDDALREVRRRHQAFKQTGRGVDAGLPAADDVVPLSLYPYLDIERLRGDYPICIFKDQSHAIAPLKRVIDQALDASGLEGDDLERCRRWTLQLESRIRIHVAKEPGDGLVKLWNVCAEELSNQYREDPEKQKKIQADLAVVRKHIASDAQLVGCDRDTAYSLLDGVWRRLDASAGTTAGREIREVVGRLSDLLALEDEESDAGLDPDHLKSAVGEGFQSDLDFEALSSLLHDAPHGESLNPSRRSRIEAIIFILTGYLRGLDEKARSIQTVPDSMSVTEFIRQLIEEQALASRTWLAARLENMGRFDEERHTALLAEDAATLWGESVVTPVPIPPIHLDCRGTMSGSDVSNLTELFDRNIPARILITVGNCVAGGEADDSEPYLPASLGERLLSCGLGGGFLCQRTLADTEGLLEDMNAFLRSEQTAVLIVYDGSLFGDSRLHQYLKSAAAAESRAVPSFRYDSQLGDDWAARFSVAGNEQPESDWPAGTVDVQKADGTAAAQAASFNPASLMLCDPSCSDHYRIVDRSEWHDDLIPLEDYAGDPRQIPFIPAASSDGLVHRVICSDHVWTQTARIRDRWRGLRELGGVLNSFAAKAEAETAEQLEAEHRDRLAAFEAEHKALLDETTGKLAEEIVANIAAGLLGEASTGPLPAVPKPVAPKLPVVETQEEGLTEAASESVEAPAEEADDELEILDEPYVETPRCTTCDECTTINNRLFAYNENKQAYIADPTAGSYRELVLAAEKCPVRIIHPGKPLNPDEPHLDELVKRAEPFR